MKKKMFAIITTIILIITLVGCTKPVKNAIVSMSWFGYDVAKEIVKDKHQVVLARKVGASGHGKENSLTVKSKVEIDNSKLFVYTSKQVDGWFVKDEKNLPKNSLNLYHEVFEGEEEHEHHHGSLSKQNIFTHEDHHHHGHEDEIDEEHAKIHFWTNPVNIIKVAKAIKDKMIEIDKVNKDFYEQNYIAYKEKLEKEIHGFKEYLNSLPEKNKKQPVLFIGHDSMGAFAKEFGLTYLPMSLHIQENGLPKPSEINKIIEEIKEHNSKFIFKPELGESDRQVEKIIETLKKDNITVTAVELNGFHNVTQEQFKNNITYLDILKQNIKNLKLVLK